MAMELVEMVRLLKTEAGYSSQLKVVWDTREFICRSITVTYHKEIAQAQEKMPQLFTIRVMAQKEMALS